MADWYRHDALNHRLILVVHVQPGAKNTQVGGLHGDALKIRLAAPAVEGKANGELLRFLADAFGVPLRQVTLKQGERSRRKVVHIEGPARPPESLWPGFR